ncbi:MAG: response regulator [Planctomycetota bacterium]|nr:MAG: response regulator [Planctomycetota bacterium]
MSGIFGRKKKSGKAKILIVEDEPEILRTVQDRLEMYKYEVLTACDGKEGLEKAIGERPDIVLLDVNMPVMDGFLMLEALRKHPEGAEIAVIMMTVRDQKEDIVRAEASGVEDYVAKPFELGELVDKVEKVLERRKAGVS